MFVGCLRGWGVGSGSGPGMGPGFSPGLGSGLGLGPAFPTMSVPSISMVWMSKVLSRGRV